MTKENPLVLELRTEIRDLKAINAELLAALRLVVEHSEYCGWGDKYERECARDEGLPAKAAEAIAKAEGR